MDSNSIKITLPDGSVREYQKGVSAAEVVKSIGSGLARASLAATIDGKPVGLGTTIAHDASFTALTFDSPEGKDIYRHSASHLMAQAVTELYPEVKVAIGPSIEDGFYYDFDRATAFTPEDLAKIEAQMAEIVKKDLPIVREELSRDQALEMFKSKGELYKTELINDLPEGEKISLYRQGEFADLCRGPHLPSTGRMRFYKLLSVAGAYWRGDEKRKMLQRIYGTAFDKKEQLEAHLQKLEEIKKRDHRKLGKEMDLFSLHDEAGAGLVCWHPKGARMRSIVEDHWRKRHFAGGYDIVYTPHIGKEWVWQTSGHLKFYKENMYSPLDIDGTDYYLKPVNCPMQILIYKAGHYSYRDLPLRWAELGTVYRYERSGTLTGLFRVRGFTQDDAHIICTPAQMDDEVLRVLDFSLSIMADFGFKDVKIELSVRDPNNLDKYAGSDEMWIKGEESLVKALQARNIDYERMEGEAVFYGPKIDIKIRDSLGRLWQCTTIQFDFNMPVGFDMTYIGEDGKEHRPYMVHRALLGSLERFFGILIEHYAGNFPLWLAPVQLAVMNITDAQGDYARKLGDRLQESEYRVKMFLGSEKVGAKIRDAEMEKIPYMAVVGDREMEAGTVSLRKHGQGDIGKMTIEELMAKLGDEVQGRK
ncbi:MAG: threonine--tRNA ligase [Candidatus Edwardsbacteria bacterium]|nr:threonine--tRNA ligase [Candidatus Edwardsbacteria bacterium]MBU1577343.1 threonine--tRNA ligase [Candidatus Edwardsbacteria bacterium]MBU2462973.1 threonine--tRNA ligase [Candidatus Edwardsbacteria bacterium]MBU2594188.1 threonine--tRNA ligase [Candidatus Edwardsbacteria bacterium]